MGRFDCTQVFSPRLLLLALFSDISIKFNLIQVCSSSGIPLDGSTSVSAIPLLAK